MQVQIYKRMSKALIEGEDKSAKRVVLNEHWIRRALIGKPVRDSSWSASWGEMLG